MLYYRADKVAKPITNIKTKIIKKKMGWCNDSNSKNYNKEIQINKKKNKFLNLIFFEYVSFSSIICL